MAETTAKKQNKTEHGLYYISIARGSFAPSFGLTASACIQGGLVSMFSATDENGITSACRRTQKQIKEQLGISTATASRNNRRLKNAELLEITGASSYVFKQDKIEGDKKWYCPTEILTGTFEITDDDGKVTFRTLTFCTCLVYAVYYTKLPHWGRNYRTLELTFKEIAEMLDIDESTVSDAVKTLRQAKLLYFPKGWVGANRYRKTKIGLRRGWSWFKEEQKFRARKAPASVKPSDERKPAQNAQKPPQTEKITREAYYGELQAAAAKKADRALNRARSNKVFKQLEDELAAVKNDYRNALIQNNEQRAKELAVKVEGIEAIKLSVLENIGLKPEMFSAEYYAQCKHCKDTGWLSDGSNCGCFNRGSPPKGKAGRNVGESNKKN